ncbi:hypothetical protein BC835DRAFT_1308560 [Cytidiella melzeri]|nr:hypothetical protein BC835DRAFT_1308560 [Cytidiella melzeri]
MPSFFSKVFGRKKDEKDSTSPTSPTVEKRSSAPTLLDGKYEAVSPPNVSPSTAHFSDNARLPQGQSKDSPLGLFRTKSKNVDNSRRSTALETPPPHLTLNLPVQKEQSNRALDVVFESGSEESGGLTAGEQRLSPAETLTLVQACSKAIIEHGGLETLGLMHPHWYAASAQVQQRLVSLYILSLGSKLPSSNPESSSALFDSELKYTRSTHDVAAVMRWGLRHLKLEGTSFGKDASEWDWYATFATSERAADFPSAAFSKTLVPLLPPGHVQLLAATLDIIESLAAHAEVTGSSGSKLTKLLGLWLVSAQRVNKDEDWADFYKRWETAGRVLEHLFLAHVREESSLMKMPVRLSELVNHYPYGTGSSTDANEDLPFLARPRFSTRRYEALFVRLSTELPTMNSTNPPRKHPLHLISKAIQAQAAGNAVLTEDALSVWEDIKNQALDGDQVLALSHVLDDETLRILTLVPDEQGKPISPPNPKDPLPPKSPVTRSQPHRRRSSSLGAANRIPANGHGRDTAAPPTDWADFSKLGFGESTLGQDLNLTIADNDVEITTPKVASPSATAASNKKRRASSPGRGRRSSMDNPRADADQHSEAGAEATRNLPALLTHVGTVTIDEAFFDFWSDTLLDPIAANWPMFVVLQLKPSVWKYNLVVIEQTYTRPAPPPLPPIPQFEPTRRPSSPRPSLAPSTRARRSFNFSPTIKRFSFFSNYNTSERDVTAKPTQKGKGSSKAASTKSPRIGEMGEILPEETEPVNAVEVSRESAPQGLGIVTVDEVQHESKEDVPVAPKAVAAAVTAGAAAPVVAEKVEEKDLSPVPLVDAEPASTSDVTPTAIEPVKTEEGASARPSISSDAKKEEEKDLSPVPFVDAEPASTSDVTPTAIEPVKTEEGASARPSISSDVAASAAEDSKVDAGKQLPPAPETVVLTGSTPGPQIALETSEPVALAQASEHAASVEPASEHIDDGILTQPTGDVVDVAMSAPADPWADAVDHVEPDVPAPAPTSVEDEVSTAPPVVEEPPVQEEVVSSSVAPEVDAPNPEVSEAPSSERTTEPLASSAGAESAEENDDTSVAQEQPAVPEHVPITGATALAAEEPTIPETTEEAQVVAGPEHIDDGILTQPTEDVVDVAKSAPANPLADAVDHDEPDVPAPAPTSVEDEVSTAPPVVEEPPVQEEVVSSSVAPQVDAPKPEVSEAPSSECTTEPLAPSAEAGSAEENADTSVAQEQPAVPEHVPVTGAIALAVEEPTIPETTEEAQAVAGPDHVHPSQQTQVSETLEDNDDSAIEVTHEALTAEAPEVAHVDEAEVLESTEETSAPAEAHKADDTIEAHTNGAVEAPHGIPPDESPEEIVHENRDAPPESPKVETATPSHHATDDSEAHQTQHHEEQPVGEKDP